MVTDSFDELDSRFTLSHKLFIIFLLFSSLLYDFLFIILISYPKPILRLRNLTSSLVSNSHDSAPETNPCSAANSPTKTS